MIDNSLNIRVVDNTDKSGKFFGADQKSGTYSLAKGIEAIDMSNISDLSISWFTPEDAEGRWLIHATGEYKDKSVSTLNFADLAKVGVF